jgi:CheY-specific phosphatase CheX
LVPVAIDDEIRESLLEPFISAVCVTLREMMGIEAAALTSHRTGVCQTSDDVSAVLPFTVPMSGALVLSFPGPTAAALAHRMLAEVTPTVDDEMIRDCVGEIANVSGGQAKALLHGSRYQFAFSTPKIVAGAGQEVLPGQSLDCLVVGFGSEVGEFTMRVCVKL